MAKLSVLAIGLLLLCSGASGQTRDQKTEEELLVPLRERSPEAAEAFRKATIDLDAQRTTEATRGYQEVLRHVPGHPPSLRRLSHLASESEEAIRLARSALGTDAAPENQAALLVALVRDVPIPQKRREEAQSLAKTVQPRAVSNRILLLTLAQASVALSDQGLLAACVDGLRRLYPEDAATRFFSGLLLVFKGDIEDARRELLAARRLGFQPSAVEPLLEQLRVASTDRAGKESGAPTRLSPESMVPPEMTTALFLATGCWVAGLLVLLLLGLILSRITLRAVERSSPEVTGRPSGWIRPLRQIYGGVLALTSIYFYVSLPFVFLLVLGTAGGLIFFFISQGVIPVQLVLLVAVIALITLWAIVKGLFFRVTDEDPGEPLTEAQAPELFSLLRDLSFRMGTRSVDAVYVVPDATLAVYERGGLLRRLMGKTDRVLVLGVGVLEEMTRLQLQAILAHEYGHFSNQDTAGGNLALHVRRTVLKSAEAMAKSGAASWYNPAWLFLNAFNRVFLRVSQGASRLQEVLADRWAVLTCGAVAFSTALAHVVRRSIEIDLLVGREVDEALESKRLVRNIYSLKAVEKTRDNASGGLAPGVASAKREKAASPCDEAQISSLSIEEAFHKAMRENASAYA